MIRVTADLIIEIQGEVGYRLAMRISDTSQRRNHDCIVELRPHQLMDSSVFDNIFAHVKAQLIQSWRGL